MSKDSIPEAKGGTPEALGESNKILILNCLRTRGTMSRADLCRLLGMSFPAVSSNVKSLIDIGYVVEVGEGDNSLGRKSTLLSYHAERGYVLGVDLGRFRIRVMFADLLGRELSSLERPTNTKDGGTGVADELKEMLLDVVAASGKDKASILSICIGVPGVLSEDSVTLAPFLPPIDLTQIRTKIGEEFAAPVIIENSINLGALGEMWHGAGRELKNFALINYGVGVGAAFIINGELYPGAHRASGEIGFMVGDPSKLRAEFDEVGVLENTISRDKIQNYIMRPDFQDEINKLIEKYKKNDVYAKLILDEIFLYVGISLINISAVLDLEAVIISGGLGNSIGRLFSKKWGEMLAVHVPYPPRLVFSELENQEGVLGAIHVALEAVYREPLKV